MIRTMLRKHHRVTDAEWRAMEGDRIHEFDEAENALLLLRRQSGATAPAPVMVQTSIRSDRCTVIAGILAHAAAHAPAVRDFRARHLPGGLLTVPEIEPWFRRHDGDARPRDVRLLPFRLADDDRVHHRLVGPHGVLDDLRRLGQSLTAMFAWAPVDAVQFVLTGQTPPVYDLVVAHERRPSWPVTDRLHLSVDPTLTPADVARAYQAARRDALGVRQHRNLSRKHLRLAAFITERPALDTRETWHERRRAWNAINKPAWRYKQDGLFRRDAELATQRLMRHTRNLDIVYAG